MSTARAIVLTGATSGIGLAAAHLLAAAGGTLILQGPEPREIGATRLRYARAAAGSNTTIHYLASNFDSPDAVPELAAGILALVERVDVLINNAAIPGPRQRTIGPWGVERTFGINYLAGALLTDLLLPKIPDAGRIVNVASATHEDATLDPDDVSFEEHPYSPVAAYAQSKLAIVTNSARLAARVSQTVLSIHPGVISTDLLHAMFGVGGSSAEHGAANLIAATTMDAPSGSYLDERTVGLANPLALDPGFQEQLHAITNRLLGRAIV
jgi:NAD(P)-dependent dehydrogenase (short-subunit alcohol dehydrogenase family)